MHEAYRQMCELEGDIPPLAKGNRFWPSDDDFRKAWRVDEEGIWLPQKLASDWPDIFWQHVVPRLDLDVDVIPRPGVGGVPGAGLGKGPS